MELANDLQLALAAARDAQEALNEGNEVALEAHLEAVVARLAAALEQGERTGRGRAAAAKRVAERRIALELAYGDLMRTALAVDAEGGGATVSLWVRVEVTREDLLAELSAGLGGERERLAMVAAAGDALGYGAPLTDDDLVAAAADDVRAQRRDDALTGERR